jgi:hypothetical protein
MSGERGEYRSVRRVLLDGPDFQRLTPTARWVFVALKLNLGPAGIEVAYLGALLVQLAQQTGFEADDVGAAIEELVAGGWVRREANVIWVVGQLENDPHMSATDPKHRKAVQRHLCSLPRLDLVKQYVKAHPAFFPRDEVRATGLGWAIEGPSKGHRSTENKTEDKKEKESSRAPRESWLSPVRVVWEEFKGAGSFRAPKAAGLLSGLKDAGHSPAEVATRLRVYLKRLDNPKFASLARFAETFADHVPLKLTQPIIVDGWISPELDALTRPPGMVA